MSRAQTGGYAAEMQHIRRQSNLTTKALTAFTTILVLAVVWHVTRLNSLVYGDVLDAADNGRSSRRSLFFTPSRQTPIVKPCLAQVSTQPPEVQTDNGALGDIKRITADWQHISAYVQSCDFQARINNSSRLQKSRGIVIPSAGHAMFAHTWVVVTILRETLGCSLPIEIVYNGQEELDVDLAERLKVQQRSALSCA